VSKQVSKSIYTAHLHSVNVYQMRLLPYAYSNSQPLSYTFKLFPSVRASQILWKFVPNYIHFISPNIGSNNTQNIHRRWSAHGNCGSPDRARGTTRSLCPRKSMCDV